LHRILSVTLFLLATLSASAQNEQSFIGNDFVIDGTKKNMPEFEAGLGTLNCNTTLGFESTVKRCGTCAVSGVLMFYRTYKPTDTPGSFNIVNASFISAGDNGVGCENTTWRNEAIQSSILQNLENSTTYKLDIYFQSNGTNCDADELKSTVYSTTFTHAKEPIISFQPIDLVNCSGKDMFFKTNATGEGTPIYQWERSDNGGAFDPFPFESATHIKDGLTKALKIDNSKAGDHNDTFRCIITDVNGCSITTQVASVSVSRESTIISTSNELCEGEANTLTSRINSGTVDSYQWQYRVALTGSSYADLLETSNFVGTQTLTLTIKSSSDSINRYRVEMYFNTVEMDDAGNKVNSTCRVAEPENIRVNPRPIKPTFSDVERCGNGVIDLTAPLDTTGYRWYTDTTQTAVSSVKTYSPNLTRTQDLFFSFLNEESCESHRTKFTVTVNPIPAVTLGSIADICPGVTSLAIPFTNLTNGDLYSITATNATTFSPIVDASISSSLISLTFPGTLSAGTYNFVLQLKNSTTDCESLDIPFTVRIKAPTVITTQPAESKVEVCEDETVSFSIVATGEGTLNYQWFKDNNALAGKDEATLSIAAASVTDEGKYTCKVTGECGEVTSSEIMLTVNAKTKISQQPENVMECEGNSSTFIVNATGSGTLTYQWKKNGVDTGVNSSSLTINNLQVADNNAQITCVITSDKCGGLTSNAATLTVILLPKAPTVISPTGFCKDEPAIPLTATSASGNSLLWWGNDATDGTSSTSAPMPITTTVGSTKYYVSQKDVNGCEGPRAEIEVVISAPVTVGISPSKTSICATGVLNKTAVLQAIPSGGNGTFTYQWSNSNGIITNEIANSITVNSADTYTVKVTSAYCTETENQVISAVLPELVNAPSATDLGICFQGTATLNATSEYRNGSFRWYDVTNGTAALSSSNPLVLNNLVGNRTVFVAYQKTTGITTCETPRKTVNVTVNPQLVISDQPQNVTKCDGNTANFTATITNATSYQWQRKLSDGNFEDISGETDENLRISSIGNSINPHLTKYRLIATNGTCSVTTDEVTLFVNSKDENLDSQTACFGANVTFSVPVTTGTIQSYEWQKRTGSSGSFEEIIGANSKDLILSNISLVEDNTYYRCRLIFNNGDGSTCVITTDDGRLTIGEVEVSLTKEGAKCFGETTGSITATASGSSGYEYQLNGGTFQSSNKFDNLVAGTYFVNVKDGDGCTATGNIIISEPSTFALVASSSTLKCNADNDGVILATAGGGTNPYEYKLNDGSFGTVSRFGNLLAGMYNVTVKDKNGCEASDNALVEEPSPIVISDVVATPASCAGATGSLTFAASGGNGGFQFKLNDGQLQAVSTFDNLSVGTYIITVQDAADCIITQSVTVGGEVTPSIITQPQNVTKCDGNTANFSAEIMNAASYQWQRKLSDGNFEDISGETDENLRISSIGNSINPHLTKYRLIATNGTCSVTTDEVTLFVNSKDENLDSQTACFGANVTFSVPVTTGTIQSYEWQKRTGSSGSFEEIIGANSKDLILSNISLVEDNTYYRCRLIFNNGDGSTCVITTDDGRLTIGEVELSLTKEGAKCFGETTGSITATASGSSGYEYQLGSGTFQSSNKFENLTAGLYTVNIKDERDCTATSNITIDEPGRVSIALTKVDVKCFGENSGIINVVAVGGTPPYSFKMNGGTSQTVNKFENLSVGTYSAEVKDNNGCTVQDDVNISQPFELKSPDFITTPATCDGAIGSITVNATGGTGTFKFKLDDGDFQSLSKFSNLSGGTYKLTVEDENGCSITQNDIVVGGKAVPVISTQPADLTNCEGNTVTFEITASNVTMYQWQQQLQNGTFTDINGENTNELRLTNVGNSTNPHLAKYRVLLQNDGCDVLSESAMLNVNSISGSTEDKMLCVGSDYALDLTNYTLTGTVSAYQWQYSSGSWGDLVNGISDSFTINNLQIANSGYYRCRITFVNSSGTCIEYNETGSGLKVEENEPPVISADKLVICDGVSAKLTASGCLGTVNWSTSETGNSINVTAAGNYIATCKLDNCESEPSGQVKIEASQAPTAPVATANITEVCLGQKVNLSATCVNSFVKWSNGESTATIQVGAGTYTATCENICGASEKSNEIIITEKDTPIAPIITADKTSICDGETTTLAAIGCSTAISWSTAETTINITVNQVGVYAATCGNSCGTSPSSFPIIINNALPMGGKIEATDATNCAGYNPPTIQNNVDPTGEDLIFQWQQRSTLGDWSDIDGANSLTYNPSVLSDTTLYRRKVSNTCGEVFSNVDTIYIAPDPSVIVTSTKSLICSNETFTLNASVNGGSGNCPISWQRNDRSAAPTSSFWNDIQGTISALIITDLSNASSANTSVYYRAVVDCQPSSCNKATADVFEIVVQPSFEFNLNFTDSIICEGNSLEIIAEGCGGTTSWSSSETTSSITVSPVLSTSYTATCTNSCGSSSKTASVNVLPSGVALPVNNTPSGVVTPATLTFAAMGTSLKWYAAESGGTGSSTPPSFTDLGTYTYWTTQSDGRCESNRLKIISTIHEPLALNGQSRSEYDCKGKSVNFYVEAVGVGEVVYQWQRKRPDETEFTNLIEDGGGIRFFYGPVLRVSAVGNVNNPHLSEYRCLVRDSLGGVFTDKMILYVNSLEGTFKNIGACIGTNYNEDISAKFKITGNVTEYQWQRRSGTSGPWDDLIDTDRIKGTPTSRLQITPLEYTDGNMYYRCAVIFNTGGLTCTENTDPSRLVVSGYPSAPLNFEVTYCQFETAKILSYKTGNSNDVFWYSPDNPQFGDTKAPKPSTDNAGEYEIYVTEITPQECESPKTAIKITVNPEPIAPTSTTPEFVKEGNDLKFTAIGENLKWYTSRTGRTHTIATPMYVKPKLYKHYVSQTLEFGCESERRYIESEIREVLKLTKIPVAQADCDGNSVTFDANADSFSNLSYQWERKQPDKIAFQKIAGETEKKLTVRDIGENGNIDGTLYRCVVRDAEDSLFTNPVPLIVNQVVGEIPDVAFCTRQQIILDSTKIKIMGLVERYEWQRQSGRSWFTIDSTLNWLNLGIADSSKTADYRLKAVFRVNARTTCNRYSSETKVVINPIPAAPVIIDYAVCKFTEQKLKIEPLEKGNQILWFISLTDSSGEIELPINLSETVGKKTFYVAERSKEGCESKRTALNFTTIPTPQKPLTDSLVNVCQFASNTNLTATAEDDLLWSSKTADDFTEERPRILTQLAGTQQFYVAAIDTNGCLSESQQIVVNVEPCIITTADVKSDDCNTIIRENVNGDNWVNFYNADGKLFGAINPNGQNLGTVTLRFRLVDKELNTPKGTALFSRYFALESSLLEKLERPVKVRVFAQEAEMSSFIDANEWFVTHYEGINEDCDPLNNDNFGNGRSVVIYEDVSVSNFIPNVDFFEFATDSFSEFGLTDNPFARISTDVSIDGNEVSVSLNITDEIRPLKYLIERSIDGLNWFSWREVNAGEPKNLIDDQPFSGKSYYRVVYQDLDGTLKYFKPFAINLEATEPVCTIFPNPVIDDQIVRLYVRNFEPVTFEFFDTMLRKWGVAVKNTEPNNYELMLGSSLAYGTYFVRATDSEEKPCVVKIVKR
jgi:hypothetical protein